MTIEYNCENNCKNMSRICVWLMTALHWSVVVYSQEIHFVESTKAPTTKCGYTNPGTLQVRFKMENVADYGEFPWMVAIIKKSNMEKSVWSQQDYVGAGSIIHPSVVISAAHWIGNLKPDEIKCRAGEWDISSDLELYEYQESNVKSIAIHPQYNKDSLHNDLSLLFLEKQYEFSIAPQIGSVCMREALPDPLPDGTQCFGMGWGMGSKTKLSNMLKKIAVTLLSRDDCETKLMKTRLGEQFQLHDSLICGTSNSESCGDDGASLVCNDKGDKTRFSIYGMNAYRVNDTDAPCVYVNVPQSYEWIGRRMAEEGLNADSYTY